MACKDWDNENNQGYVMEKDSLYEGENGQYLMSDSLNWQPSDFYIYKADSAQWIKENLTKYFKNEI